MSQVLTPPTATLDNATGIDQVCDTIIFALSQLPFLQTVLGRIHPQYNEAGNLEPWVWKSGTEYYKAFPNDQLDSFSCLLPHNDEQFLSGGYFGQRSLSVIVWLNLDRQAGKPRTVEFFKHQVVAALRELSCVTSIERAVDQAVSGSYAAVYPGFDLSELKAKYMALPYGAFRVECVVNYFIGCP